jgi:hypothetical protein
MDDKWQSKLRRLGVVKGARNLKPAPMKQSDPHPSSLNPQSLEKLLPGLELVETAVSACYVLDKVYPLS